MLKTDYGPGSAGMINGVLDSVSYKASLMMRPIYSYLPPPKGARIKASVLYESFFMLFAES